MMERSRIDLANAIDKLVQARRAAVTETRGRISIYQLDGVGARSIWLRLESAGFKLVRIGDEGGDFPPRID